MSNEFVEKKNNNKKVIIAILFAALVLCNDDDINWIIFWVNANLDANLNTMSLVALAMPPESKH